MPSKVLALAAALALSLAGWRGVNILMKAEAATASPPARGDQPMPQKTDKTDEQWKAELTAEQYSVLRACGTERAFTGKYNDFFKPGTYVCAACGNPLFSSTAKYDHGTGWPSFTAALEEKSVSTRKDTSFFMTRTEVRCASCGGHLGHVFDDGPAPSGLHYCINSAALDFVPAGGGARITGAAREAPGRAPAKNDVATFAAGCFWGVEAKFRELPGVVETTVGYTGGQTPKPTYEQVCSDSTGHAESIEIVFDPARISYEKLVREFFDLHDPTQVNRQGPDVGTQYRSAIFYHNEEQKETARRIMAELSASGRYKRPIATQLIPASTFYPAEEYHQRYYEKKGRK